MALNTAGHTPVASLTVNGHTNIQYNLDWELPEQQGGYREPKKNTELGAVAISFLIANNLLGYTSFFEGHIGDGVDYWMGYSEDDENYDPYNYLKARLEVSGIGAESSTNTVQGRVNTKVRQTTPTDDTGLDAYISIIEFSNPKATFRRK